MKIKENRWKSINDYFVGLAGHYNTENVLLSSPVTVKCIIITHSDYIDHEGHLGVRGSV